MKETMYDWSISVNIPLSFIHKMITSIPEDLQFSLQNDIIPLCQLSELEEEDEDPMQQSKTAHLQGLTRSSSILAHDGNKTGPRIYTESTYILFFTWVFVGLLGGLLGCGCGLCSCGGSLPLGAQDGVEFLTLSAATAKSSQLHEWMNERQQRFQSVPVIVMWADLLKVTL